MKIVGYMDSGVAVEVADTATEDEIIDAVKAAIRARVESDFDVIFEESD